MASRSLGSLTLDLLVKTGAFIQGMTAAERQANKSMTAIEKRAYAFGQALGKALKVGAIAAAAGASALAVAVSKAIDNADDIRDLSIRIGIGTEALSGYAYAAKQTGTDIEGLGRGLKILAKNAAEAADATSGKGKLFEALGVNVKDAAGNLKQLDVLLPEVADKFKELEDGTTKAALAQELFGKSGLELTEFLNQGADGLDAMAKKAAALGIVISQETADAADEFNDQLGDLKAEMGGLSTQIAAELLPDLIRLVKAVNEFVADGGNAVKIADGIGKSFDVLSGIWGVASKTIEVVNAGFGTMIGLMASATTVAQGLISLDFSKIGKGLAGGLAALQAGTSMALLGGPGGGKNKVLLDPNRPDFSGVSARVQGRKTLQEQLNDLFNGEEKGAKKSGKKTPASEKIDKIKEAYEQLSASMAKQIELFGKTGEAVELRYDLEHGELSKLTQAQKDSLIAQAEKLDLLEQERKAEEEMVKLRADQDEAFTQANEAILDQIHLIGLSADEQELYNNLTWAGVDAESARGKEIIANTQKLQEQRETMSDQIELMDTIRDAGSDFLTDWVSGSKSLKDSLLDAWESVHNKILQMIAENLMDQLFGQQGDPAGGSTAGWFSQLLGAFFGGGKAGGGMTRPNTMYQVNERGFEMASVGGKDYLLSGSSPVQITPNHKLGGGGLNVTQVFNNPIMADRRSDGQRQLQAGRELRVATRNS